jgi:hypothetical protein
MLKSIDRGSFPDRRLWTLRSFTITLVHHRW